MEKKRLDEAREKNIPWKKWGPYLSERQWGTVREDYLDRACGEDDPALWPSGPQEAPGDGQTGGIRWKVEKLKIFKLL